MKYSIKDVSVGMNADQPPEELQPGAWSRVLNMRFREGCAERFKGITQVFSSTSVVPYCCAPFVTATARFWVHAGLAKVFVDDGTTRTEITNATPYTGAVDDRWSLSSFHGILIANNGVDKPQYWNGDTGTDLAPLTGWDANWRAAVVRPFKDYLVALDLTKSTVRYPHMVKWSHVADPGAIPTSWDAADPSKDAGEQDLAETSDLLVDALPLGDALIIYKERSMYSMTYIGGQFIFRFQRLPGEVGMLARGCAVNTPVGHVVLTNGDLVVHQGGEPRSIVAGRMRRWLFTTMDATYYRRAFLALNQQRNEVWVCFPSTGQTSCDLALVWNWVDNTFGVRQLSGVTYGASGQISAATSTGGTWATDTETWAQDATTWSENEYTQGEGRLMLCDASSRMGLADTGSSDFTSTASAVLERVGMGMDIPERVKLLRAVYPHIVADAGAVVQVEAGGAMTINESPIWSAPVNFTVGTDQKVDLFAVGRYLSLRFSSAGASIWRVRSVDFDVVPQGLF